VTDESPAEIAKRFGLPRVGVRPPLGRYLVEAWRRRAFAATLAGYRIQSENERNRFGLAWVVIKPLLNALVYGLVFGLILPSDTRPDNFIPYLLVGVFIFEFFSASLSDGSKAITSNARLVQSLSFPRILLAFAVVLEQIFRLIPIVVVLLLLLLLFGETPSWTWLLLVPILMVMAVFNAGVAMIAARMSVHFRDIQQVIPFGTRLIFYTSSIFFSVDLIFAERPTLLAIAHANPVYEFIALCREVLIAGPPVPPQLWWWAALWTVGVFLFGLVFFWYAEERYGRE
jgi:teichoic acid transport system permease protein